jgi:3-oxoacyl-[acyl-carrier protein] reductase
MPILDGKVALVSGAGRGIGRAIALKLAAEGARVVVNDVDQSPADEVVAAIEAAGGTATAYVGSVTAPGFADRFVDTAISRYNCLDIIVNNAGYTWDSVIQKMTDEQWQALLDVHMTAPFCILRAAAGFIREARKAEAAAGREVFRKVINISSIAGLGGSAGQVNYSAAKAGVIGLTMALAKEWGRYRVNVNCVAFGLIRTRLTDVAAAGGAGIEIEGRSIPVRPAPEFIDVLERLIPLQRFGTPEEAAGAVYLLCRPESDYISGQTLVCGGGLTI